MLTVIVKGPIFIFEYNVLCIWSQKSIVEKKTSGKVSVTQFQFTQFFIATNSSQLSARRYPNNARPKQICVILLKFEIQSISWI